MYKTSRHLWMFCKCADLRPPEGWLSAAPLLHRQGSYSSRGAYWWAMSFAPALGCGISSGACNGRGAADQSQHNLRCKQADETGAPAVTV